MSNVFNGKLDNKPTEGKKFDQNKPDLSLIPSEFSAEVARAFMHGEKKYGRYNYLNGMEWSRIVAALKRHVDAFWDGEDLDSESGYSHLGHAGACLAMLMVYKNRNLGTDNRYKPTVAQTNDEMPESWFKINNTKISAILDKAANDEGLTSTCKCGKK